MRSCPSSIAFLPKLELFGIMLAFLPKFDGQAVKAMSYDKLFADMIQDIVGDADGDGILKVAICQDGRMGQTGGAWEIKQAPQTTEAANFLKLVNSHMGHAITVAFEDISFWRPGAEAREIASEAHVLIFCGYGRGDPAHTKNVLAQLQPGCVVADRVRSRVQAGRLLWLGICGGAMCAGRRYIDHSSSAYRDAGLGLDIFNGVSVTYEAGQSPTAIGASTTNTKNLMMTSFSSLVLWTQRPAADGPPCSTFVVSKNGQGPDSEKARWCRDNAVKLRAAIEEVAKYWHWAYRGPTPVYAWSLEGWWCRLEGESVGPPQRINPRHRDLQRPEPVRMPLDLGALD